MVVSQGVPIFRVFTVFTLTAIYLISFIAKTNGHSMKGRFLIK